MKKNAELLRWLDRAERALAAVPWYGELGSAQRQCLAEAVEAIRVARAALAQAKRENDD